LYLYLRVESDLDQGLLGGVEIGTGAGCYEPALRRRLARKEKQPAAEIEGNRHEGLEKRGEIVTAPN
jgi:hypothetical protein